MPRRRFSDYKKAIKLLRTSTSGAAPPSLPAGSPLAEYQDYVAGNKNITYTRVPTSLPKSLDKIGIKPFGYVDDPKNIVPVLFSKRVKDATAMATIIAVSNQITTGDFPLDLENFEPAKAIVTQTTGTSTTSATSQITGRAYQKRPKNSYTIPFGRDSSADVELTIRNAITTAVTAVTTTDLNVSFRSERV